MALLLCLFIPSIARAQMRYFYASALTETDKRAEFYWTVLRAALDRTQAEFGPYVLKPGAAVPDNRHASEMNNPNGQITVAVHDMGFDRESDLVPIRIPVDHGLLGYRILLIRDADQQRFHAIKTVEDLKTVRLGVEFDWQDAQVLTHNGLEIVAGQSYESLFLMLERGRFDAFPRGCTEIGNEFADRTGKIQDLRIEDSLVIYSPLPIYFWFSRTPEGLALAARAEKGLRAMIADGSHDRMVRDYFRPYLKALKFDQRRLIRLDNPFVKTATPKTNPELWLTLDEILEMTK
jgi:ABC-type amino acid transport substrate-binding protein